MGASAWRHTVAYHPDIEVAYQHARQQAFETGDYFHWWEFYQHESKPNPFPTTIAALLKAAGENGTHSILDYSDLVIRWWACSAETLIDIFGTTTPTPSMIATVLDDMRNRNRIDGNYVVGYVDDQPVTITFIGASGD